MRKISYNLFCGEDAATLVEYALLVTLIATVIATVVMTFGTSVLELFNRARNRIGQIE